MTQLIVLPVIHHLDHETSLDQAALAFEAGADGVFLISHHGEENAIIRAAHEVKRLHPNKSVGLNFLTHDILTAAGLVRDGGFDMLWGDTCGVSSQGINGCGKDLSHFAKSNPSIQVFGSVAFKYQDHEPHPDAAARHALAAGFIPTTSGPATGSSAPLSKIQMMSEAAGGKLAKASGLTVDNIVAFRPYLSHALVATGVSIAGDEHHFDFELMCRFIGLARK